jgi:hypothetical protein
MLTERYLVDKFLRQAWRYDIDYDEARREVPLHLGYSTASATFDRIQADIILENKAKAWVCEAKVVMNPGAIGQALVAAEIYRELTERKKEIIPVVITSQAKRVLVWAAQRLKVRVIEVI